MPWGKIFRIGVEMGKFRKMSKKISCPWNQFFTFPEFMIGKSRASIGVAAVMAAWVQIGSLFATYSGLVAFGDSLTDQGNTINYLIDNLPKELWVDAVGYDDNYYNAAYNIYDIKAAGRWSSGPTWIEYFNGLLKSGGTSIAPIALGRNFGVGWTSSGTDYGPGTNFAWGGSTTDAGYTYIVFSNLQQQVADFISLTQDSKSALYQYDIGGALFSVWSGGNDAIYWVQGDRSISMEVATTTAASNIQAAITTLYNAGARHFLMTNLPDLGQKPNYRGTDWGMDATAFVLSFNAKLEEVVLTLETTYADISIAFFDAYSKFNLLLDDPESFGFTNFQDPAYIFLGYGEDPSSIIVPDPTEYVFWDTTHPTTQVHQLIGMFAYEALAIPEPGSVLLLMLGLGVLAWRRYRVRSYSA